MENFNEQKYKLLENIGILIKAINKEVDWFLAYLGEKDKYKKKLYESVYLSKREAVSKLAKKFYDQYK